MQRTGRDDDDDDEVDPLCVTGVDSVGGVETGGGASNLTFFLCLVLHQRVDGATSEDMALMIRVLHCSVWSRESP